jgi:hypothetical protein
MRKVLIVASVIGVGLAIVVWLLAVSIGLFNWPFRQA